MKMTAKKTEREKLKKEREGMERESEKERKRGVIIMY